MNTVPNAPNDRKRISAPILDLVWQAVKAGLCVLQLLILAGVSAGAVTALRAEMIEPPSLGFAAIHLGTVLLLLLVLWRYYDSIDDRGFDRFCATEPSPVLLRTPAYLTGLGISVLGATPVLAAAVADALFFLLPAWPAGGRLALAMGGSLLLTAGIGVLRLHRLTYEWSVQKSLRRPTDKRHKRVARVLYALVFFGALAFAIYMIITIFLPILGSVVVAFFKLAWGVLLVLVVAALVLYGIHLIRRVLERRRYLARLEALRRARELDYSIHGHPYRSLFSTRVLFGLTVVDQPHPGSRSQEVRTFCVTFANCDRRHMAVVLCENQVYQVMYNIKIRAIGALGMTNMENRFLSIPLGSWFVNHSFTFPDAEGERILIVDPAPRSLWLRDPGREELAGLDNGSKLFGYTVYGKQAFLSVLERT